MTFTTPLTVTVPGSKFHHVSHNNCENLINITNLWVFSLCMVIWFFTFYLCPMFFFFFIVSLDSRKHYYVLCTMFYDGYFVDVWAPYTAVNRYDVSLQWRASLHLGQCHFCGGWLELVLMRNSALLKWGNVMYLLPRSIKSILFSLISRQCGAVTSMPDFTEHIMGVPFDDTKSYNFDVRGSIFDLRAILLEIN